MDVHYISLVAARAEAERYNYTSDEVQPNRLRESHLRLPSQWSCKSCTKVLTVQKADVKIEKDWKVLWCHCKIVSQLKKAFFSLALDVDSTGGIERLLDWNYTQCFFKEEFSKFTSVGLSAARNYELELWITRAFHFKNDHPAPVSVAIALMYGIKWSSFRCIVQRGMYMYQVKRLRRNLVSPHIWHENVSDKHTFYPITAALLDFTEHTAFCTQECLMA